MSNHLRACFAHTGCEESEPVVGLQKQRIVIAVPVDEAVVDYLRSMKRDVEWCWEPDLLPTRRFVGDYAGDPGFSRTPSEQRRFEALLDSADVLFGIPDTSPAALRRTAVANPALRWVHTMAAGGGAELRAADLPPARRETLVVTTSAGVHGSALAEFAVLGLLAGLKDLPRWTADKAARRWPERTPVRQLRDATVLVLGTGGIGARVAELLASFGSEVWGAARRLTPASPPFSRMIAPEGLGAALASVDALVCALPGTDATTHLVDAGLLAQLRTGAVVVNVGRGTVIDEQALVAALDDGRVGFAALDVFEQEPLPQDSPLWTRERVLLSPHTAALDAGEERRIAELFIENLRRLRQGRALINVVDPVEFY